MSCSGFLTLDVRKMFRGYAPPEATEEGIHPEWEEVSGFERGRNIFCKVHSHRQKECWSVLECEHYPTSLLKEIKTWFEVSFVSMTPPRKTSEMKDLWSPYDNEWYIATFENFENARKFAETYLKVASV